MSDCIGTQFSLICVTLPAPIYASLRTPIWLTLLNQRHEAPKVAIMGRGSECRFLMDPAIEVRCLVMRGSGTEIHCWIPESL